MADGALGGSAPVIDGPAEDHRSKERASANMEECSLTALVGEHHEFIYRYAYRLSGRASDAEDLTQQTFLIAQRKLSHLREASRARSWLGTILRHAFLRSVRRRGAGEKMSVGFDFDLLPDETSETDPFAPFEFDREELQTALDELPVEFRLVVLMFYYEDCSYREIATRLEMPLGTVMSRLARAKQRLRQRLDKTVGVSSRAKANSAALICASPASSTAASDV
jgi:RNA polymerase sigma-70 factor (ECF subfamily)